MEASAAPCNAPPPARSPRMVAWIHGTNSSLVCGEQELASRPAAVLSSAVATSQITDGSTTGRPLPCSSIANSIGSSIIETCGSNRLGRQSHTGATAPGSNESSVESGSVLEGDELTRANGVATAASRIASQCDRQPWRSSAPEVIAQAINSADETTSSTCAPWLANEGQSRFLHRSASLGACQIRPRAGGSSSGLSKWRSAPVPATVAEPDGESLCEVEAALADQLAKPYTLPKPSPSASVLPRLQRISSQPANASIFRWEPRQLSVEGQAKGTEGDEALPSLENEADGQADCGADASSVGRQRNEPHAQPTQRQMVANEAATPSPLQPDEPPSQPVPPRQTPLPEEARSPSAAAPPPADEGASAWSGGQRESRHSANKHAAIALAVSPVHEVGCASSRNAVMTSSSAAGEACLCVRRPAPPMPAVFRAAKALSDAAERESERLPHNGVRGAWRAGRADEAGGSCEGLPAGCQPLHEASLGRPRPHVPANLVGDKEGFLQQPMADAPDTLSQSVPVNSAPPVGLHILRAGAVHSIQPTVAWGGDAACASAVTVPREHNQSHSSKLGSAASRPALLRDIESEEL